MLTGRFGLGERLLGLVACPGSAVLRGLGACQVFARGSMCFLEASDFVGQLGLAGQTMTLRSDQASPFAIGPLGASVCQCASASRCSRWP